MASKGIKIIVRHKRASYDYSLKESFEAGIVLQGTEVKSLRDGKATIAESHVIIDKNGEMWIHNMTIPHYTFGNIQNHEETRKRKLLLNHKEIDKIYHIVKSQSLTIIPTKLYFKGRHVKMEIALARGKKLHDKRHDQAKKDAARKLQQRQYD